MGNPAGLDKRRRMKLILVCSVVILIAVIDNATGATDPCACLHEMVHPTIKAQLKCEAGCMKKGSDNFPEYDPQREKDLKKRAYNVKYVCFPFENADNDTVEVEPGLEYFVPKDCSEKEAFKKKIKDADQIYDKMEKLISEAEEKFGIRKHRVGRLVPPELEDLKKRYNDIDLKCSVQDHACNKRRQPVRPSLRTEPLCRNYTPPAWDSKECREERAFKDKFYITRLNIYDYDHDADKEIKEMEKIVSEAEKKWGIWKPDPLSERYSNIWKQVDHIKNYCKFRIANHKTLEHLKEKGCFDKAALFKVFVVTDDMFEKMVIKAEKLVSDVKEEWGIEQDK